MDETRKGFDFVDWSKYRLTTHYSEELVSYIIGLIMSEGHVFDLSTKDIIYQEAIDATPVGNEKLEEIFLKRSAVISAEGCRKKFEDNYLASHEFPLLSEDAIAQNRAEFEQRFGTIKLGPDDKNKLPD